MENEVRKEQITPETPLQKNVEIFTKIYTPSSNAICGTEIELGN
jgi:hypothetical protein